MKPITNATVAYMLNSNVVYVEFADKHEGCLNQIKTHYDALSGFRVDFDLPKVTIFPNSNFLQADILRDLAELLKSLDLVDGIEKIRWSWAQGVEEASSDSLEELLKTMPIVTDHL